MRLAALVAGVGAVIGGAVATAMHFVILTGSIGMPQGYAGYVPLSAVRPSPYSSTLTVQWSGAIGVHPSWWPLIPVGLGLGLGVGAILGAVLGAAGVRFGRPPRTDAP